MNESEDIRSETMIRYKVLKPGRISPYEGTIWDLHKEYVCGDFCEDRTISCAPGFYATDLDGLCFAYRPGYDIYECEVGGRSVEYNIFKMRYEKMTLLRKVSKSEIRDLMRRSIWSWDVEHAVFPVNPFDKTRASVSTVETEMLQKWASVRASVRASVWASVGASVRDSVWDSVGASVGDSIGAYISSLFPGIKTWKYITHAPGINPFQPAVDLWHRGLVASFDGTIWRLHNRDKLLYESSDLRESGVKG